MSEPDGPPPAKRIPVDALLDSQREDRQPHRRRVIALTTATLAATGVVGGVAFSMLSDDEDGGQQPTAQSTDTTALPTDETTDGSGIPTPSPSTDEETDSGSVGESVPTGEPEAAPEAPRAAPAAPERHVVAPGESLWSITADLLGPGATAQQVLDSWPELYEANRDVIGADPDLIVVGQQLTLPSLN